MYLLAFAETIQLFPDGTLFIHVALILLMIWVLNRTLYRPINKILEAREKNKGGRSSEAVEILNGVREKESHYTSELLDARSQGYQLIEKEQRGAAESRDNEIAAVKSEVANKLSNGRAEIEKQAADAKTSIRTDAVKMADRIAASILK